MLTPILLVIADVRTAHRLSGQEAKQSKPSTEGKAVARYHHFHFLRQRKSHLLRVSTVIFYFLSVTVGEPKTSCVTVISADHSWGKRGWSVRTDCCCIPRSRGTKGEKKLTSLQFFLMHSTHVCSSVYMDFCCTHGGWRKALVPFSGTLHTWFVIVWPKAHQ